MLPLRGRTMIQGHIGSGDHGEGARAMIKFVYVIRR